MSSNENKLTPRLRFPEFQNSGEWEVIELSKLCDITKGEQLNKTELTETGKYPYLNGGIYPSGYTEKFNTPANTITISEGGNSCGYVNFMKTNFWLGGHCYKLTLKTNIEKIFLYYVLKFNEKRIMSIRVGSGLPNIQKKSLLKLKIQYTPSLPEQQKIADCLSSLDEVIAGERQKLELLKAHKKGLLQNLFPQEGETVPKLRFPEFQDSGEWEYSYGNKLFEQIVNKKHNSNLPILAITQEYGAVPREMIDYFISVTDTSIQSYKVVEIGDFIISLRSFQGGIEFSRYKGLCSPAYIILRNKVDLVKDFYRHYFKTSRFIKDLNKNIEGIRDGKMVSYKQFSEILIPLPSLPEQQKIAACLSSLDDVIQAQEQKIEWLELHKKGLLQGLFPNVKDIDNG